MEVWEWDLCGTCWEWRDGLDSECWEGWSYGEELWFESGVGGLYGGMVESEILWMTFSGGLVATKLMLAVTADSITTAISIAVTISVTT